MTITDIISHMMTQLPLAFCLYLKLNLLFILSIIMWMITLTHSFPLPFPFPPPTFASVYVIFTLNNSKLALTVIYFLSLLLRPSGDNHKSFINLSPIDSMCSDSFLNLLGCLIILLYISSQLPLYTPQTTVHNFYHSDKTLPSH